MGDGCRASVCSEDVCVRGKDNVLREGCVYVRWQSVRGSAAYHPSAAVALPVVGAVPFLIAKSPSPPVRVRIGFESMPVLGSIPREIMAAPSGLLSWKYNACFPVCRGERLARGIALARVPVKNTAVAKFMVQRWNRRD